MLIDLKEQMRRPEEEDDEDEGFIFRPAAVYRISLGDFDGFGLFASASNASERLETLSPSGTHIFRHDWLVREPDFVQSYEKKCTEGCHGSRSLPSASFSSSASYSPCGPSDLP
jgi:hypothetical protein